MLTSAEKGRPVASRIKGRPALVKRLRSLMLAVHRYGRGRARHADDVQWAARVIDGLYAVLAATESQRPPDAR